MAEPEPTDQAAAQGTGSNEQSDHWGRAENLTMTGAMVVLAAGSLQRNRYVRAVGVGLISARSAVKAGECAAKLGKEVWGIGINVATAFGTALWATGIGADNRPLSASAGMKFCRNKDDWRKDAIDAAEALTFSVVGATGHPTASAMAFGVAAAGFSYDALYGQAAGAAVWSAGAGSDNPPAQSAGAALIAASEFWRFLASFRTASAAPGLQDLEAANMRPTTPSLDMVRVASAVPLPMSRPSTPTSRDATETGRPSPAASPASARRSR